MRVLLLPHRYLPESRGGVETWAQTLSAALHARGHAVAILTMAADVGADVAPFSVVQGPEATVPVHRLRHRLTDARSFRETWGDDRFRRPVGAVLDSFEPDVVHVGHPDGWGVIPLREAGRRGLVVGVTLHDYKWICARGQMVRPSGDLCGSAEEDACVRCISDQLSRTPGRAWLSRLLPATSRDRLAGSVGTAETSPTARRRWRDRQRQLLREVADAHVVTSPSRFVATRFAEHGLDREVVVIPNAPGHLRAAAHQTRAGTLRIGYFGNAHPAKGLDTLLDAFESLPDRSATLDLFGPSDTDVSRPAPGVRAHGRYQPEEVLALMARVDVAAIPSTWDENHPIVAVEARAAGLPLLVSDRGGLPELVRDGVDGWILPAGDAEAWGERLALLAATPSTVDIARSEVSTPGSADVMAAAYEDLWARWLESPGRVDSSRPGPGQ